MNVAQQLYELWLTRLPHVSDRVRNYDKLNRSRNARPAKSYALAREDALARGCLCQYASSR